MSELLYYLANAIIAYALLLVLWTALKRPTSIRYAFANMFRQRRRSGITLLAIIMGGVAVFIFGGFVQHSFSSLREQTIRTNLGHLQLYREGYLASGATNPLRYGIPAYEEIKRVLAEDAELGPMLKTVTGQIEFSGIASQYESETSTFISGVGIEPTSSLTLGALDRIVLGSDLSRIDGLGATIGTGVAKGLSATYDDDIDLLVVNPTGGQNAMSVTVRGVMQSGIKEYDDRALKLPLKTAQDLLETDEVSRIILLLNDTELTDAALVRVKALIAERGFKLEVRPWSELAVYYHQVVSLFDGIFFFIKSIVSVIVVFMIGNTLMMNVVERTREIATLRALGLTQREVGRLFILEGIFIGLLGAALSVLVGIALAELININGLPMPPSPGYTKGYLAFILWDENFGLFWFTCALAIVTAVLASIIPAKRASKLLIAEAFRFT
jgi:putative ABC transport system permease protein